MDVPTFPSREGGVIGINESAAEAGAGAAQKRNSTENPYVTDDVEAGQCAKQAAVRAYSLGWLTLDSCASLFRRNPSWRNA